MLIDWLKKAGFVSIYQTPIKGEDVYTVYKPVGETTISKTSN